MAEEAQDLELAPELGLRLRQAIRAIAGARRISIAELGRRTKIGEQKMRDRLDDTRQRPPTRISVEETAAVAHALDVDVVELVRYAVTGEGFPLRT